VRAAARLVAVVGAVAVGWLLFGAGPREVVLVYDLAQAPRAASLEVRLRRDGETVRRAVFAVPAGGEPIRHPLKLSDGSYVLGWKVEAPDGPREGERALEISEGGTIVLPIGR
jgi:hypothetical protein